MTSFATSFLDTLRKARRRAVLRSLIPDGEWRDRIFQHSVDLDQISFDRKTNGLKLNEIDLVIWERKHEFLMRDIRVVNQMKHLADATFEIVDGDVQVAFGNVKMFVETFQDLFILNEIFIEGVYNLGLSRNAVVMDIGMNVGYASLFFAKNTTIDCIYGFEPFEKTYLQARKNFLLNPKLSHKISAFNYGLGRSDEVLSVDYSDEARGVVGIKGVSDRADVDRSKLSKERFELRDADRALRDIRLRHPDATIIAKVDTEGSEYDILETWNASGRLAEIDILMMEWHDPKQNDIASAALNSAGFQVVGLSPYSPDVRMIYALNTHRS